MDEIDSCESWQVWHGTEPFELWVWRCSHYPGTSVASWPTAAEAQEAAGRHFRHGSVDGARAGLRGSTEPMHGQGDLALFLGGSEDSFTGVLLGLIAKADPHNRRWLGEAFPAEVQAWTTWQAADPAPTADQMRAALVQHGPDQSCDCIRFKHVRPFHCAAAYR